MLHILCSAIFSGEAKVDAKISNKTLNNELRASVGKVDFLTLKLVPAVSKFIIGVESYTCL